MSRMKRPKQPMPPDVDQVLRSAGVLDAYRERPAYLRNEHLGWNG